MSDFRHAPVAPVLRSLLLDRLYTVKGLTEARGFYGGAAYSPPFGKEFHLKMLELESVQQFASESAGFEGLTKFSCSMFSE